MARQRFAIVGSVLLALVAVLALTGVGEVTGNLGSGVVKDSHINASAGIQASKLATRTLVSFPQSLLSFRVWDALGTILPATGATDDLALVTGTFGTNAPEIQTGDVKALGAVTRRARVLVSVPDNYVNAGGLQVRCTGGMRTTIAGTSATVDIECHLLNDDGTVSADICSTAAQSINSLTFANKDFVIDPTSVTAGSRLDVRVTIATNDAASGTAVIGCLNSLALRADCQP